MDNTTQNRTIVKTMGALERCKAGLVDFQGLEGLCGPQRSEERGPAVPCWASTQCVRQEWDNWTQNGTMVLPMGARERFKAS